MDFPNNPTEEAAFRNRKRYPFIGAPGPVAARNPESQWIALEHEAVFEVLWNDPLNVDSPTADLCGKVVRQGAAKYTGVSFCILSRLIRKFCGFDDVNWALHLVSVSLRLVQTLVASTRLLPNDESSPTG
jgi:hypothetical protein